MFGCPFDNKLTKSELALGDNGWDAPGAQEPEKFAVCQSEFMFNNQSNHGGFNGQPYEWDREVDKYDRGSLCHRGYAGDLCSVCQDGFSKSSGGCNECATTEGAVAWLGIVGFVIFIKILQRLKRKAMATPIGSYIKVAGKVVPTLVSDVRVFISVYQTVGNMGVTLALSWPEEVEFWIDYMRSLVSFDLFSLPAVGCFVTGNFYHKLWMMLSLPSAVLLLIYLVHEHQFDKLNLGHIPDVERDATADRHLKKVQEMHSKLREAESKDSVHVGIFRFSVSTATVCHRAVV